MDQLSRLFNSAARVRLLRLFFFNPEESFNHEEACKRAKISSDDARTELLLLKNSGCIRRVGSGTKASYKLNPKFPYFEALDTFIRQSTIIEPRALAASLKKAGNIRLVVLSGFFTGVTESRLDLLVVGDQLMERTLSRLIQSVEADLGREIRYATFTTEDFQYRVGIYDRLIRDVLDYPNRVLIDRITS